MQAFDIQVQDRRNGEWKHRETIEANRPNDALKAYGLRGSRPYTRDGVTMARSNSGKLFRAMPEVLPR